ncbi:hypothetical protein ACSFA2_16755 [Variovorax sp. LT2P21]|uniref:hypothetical protein n=1 Tax=Variovorax sp. LT2P21 TaxID=3443731 RepID=UPI003F4514DF
MGLPSFLTNSSDPNPSLKDCIEDLRRCSQIFVRAWEVGDVATAVTVSMKAFVMLDHIAGAILRSRDDMHSASSYSGSKLQAGLDKVAGSIVKKARREDHEYIADLAPGRGVLPPHRLVEPLALDGLLSKVKHRIERAMNFRTLPDGQHYLLFCVDRSNKPDAVVEFEVSRFVSLCSDLVPHV